jgi:hypothetical protein
MLVIIGPFAFNPGVSLAKSGDEQDQIILLNDSASALEESDPGLSRILTQYADSLEKDWENKNANKVEPASPAGDKDHKQLQDEIKNLKAAAIAIQPAYPLIAKGLDQMALDLKGTTKE